MIKKKKKKKLKKRKRFSALSPDSERSEHSDSRERRISHQPSEPSSKQTQSNQPAKRWSPHSRSNSDGTGTVAHVESHRNQPAAIKIQAQDRCGYRFHIMLPASSSCQHRPFSWSHQFLRDPHSPWGGAGLVLTPWGPGQLTSYSLVEGSAAGGIGKKKEEEDILSDHWIYWNMDNMRSPWTWRQSVQQPTTINPSCSITPTQLRLSKDVVSGRW